MEASPEFPIHFLKIYSKGGSADERNDFWSGLRSLIQQSSQAMSSLNLCHTQQSLSSNDIA